MRSCLVINEPTVFRRIITSILEKEGYSVAHADDAAKGVDMCIETNWDLVIVDAALPTEGSLSTVSRIRYLEHGFAPKIILITPDRDVATIARALHDGANEYLCRPFDTHDVRDKLTEVGLRV